MVSSLKLSGGVLLILLTLSVGGWAEQSVPRFGIFETTFAGPEGLQKPYEEVDVSVTFTGPLTVGSPKLRLEAFWDGGSVWKVRMSPTQTGGWTWRTTSSVKKLDGLTGRFACTPSLGEGFLHIKAPAKPHLILRAGKPVYLLGAGGAALSDFSLKNGSFQRYVDTRLAQGFNYLHYSPVTTAAGNEGGKPFIDREALRPNPRFFQSADQRMYYCALKGMTPAIGIGPPAKLDRDKLKRLWRYVIARYAAFDVIWVMPGQAAEAEGLTRTLAELTRKHDPYNRLIMADGPGGKTWPDIILHRGADDKSIAQLRKLDKPVVSIHSCIENLTGDLIKALYPTGDADAVRRAAWTVAMHGGYPVYEAVGLKAEKPKTFNSVGARQVGIIGKFFRQIDWSAMAPGEKALLKGNAIVVKVKPSGGYVAYLPTGGTVSLDVSGMKEGLQVQWFDPRRGRVTHSLKVPARKVLTVKAPDARNDWVLNVFESRAARVNY